MTFGTLAAELTCIVLPFEPLVQPPFSLYTTPALQS
jgi:hypothetical protein